MTLAVFAERLERPTYREIAVVDGSEAAYTRMVTREAEARRLAREAFFAQEPQSG
jgi:hypothetical protein